MGQVEARRLARDGDRQRPEQIALLQHGRPAEQLVVAALHQRVRRGIETRGRHHAEVDYLGRAVRLRDYHEAAAPETAHPGFEHAQSERSGERGVDRVAAALEDLRARLGGAGVLGRDQAARAGNDGFAQRPGFLRRGAHNPLQP